MAVPTLTAHEGIAETTVKSVGSTEVGPYLPQWLDPTALPTSGTPIGTSPDPRLHHVYPWFSTDSSFQPNSFSPTNTQAMYSVMWENTQFRPWQFAYRSLWFGGAIYSCAGNLPAAESAPAAYDPNASKSYIGLLSEAATTRGGSPYDRFFVTGSLNLGATIFNESASNELEPSDHGDFKNGEPEDLYRRRWVSSLAGSENYATMSNSLAPQNSNGDLLGPVDVRLTNYRETDLWNYSPAIVRREIGCRTTAFVDNAAPGSVEFAYGIRGAVVTDTATTERATVPLVLGYKASLVLGGGRAADGKATSCFTRNFLNSICVANSTPTLANFDESLGDGIINDWAGIEVESPQYDSDMVEVRSKVGVMIEDLDPQSAGGAPHLIEDGLLLDPEEGDRAISIERIASVVTRSNALFERTPVNGALHSVGETQLVYLRDVLHLVPRTTRPSFDPGKRGDKTVLRPSDKVGILYFDAGRNALMLSLPIVGTNGNTSSLPEDPPVVWAKLDMQTTEIDPGVDVAGYLGGNPYSEDPSAVHDAIQGSDATAEYAEPRISVELDPTDSDYLLITADARFGNIGAESIWWRRAGYGVEYKGRTEWVSLEQTSYSTTGTPRQFRVNRNDFLNHVGAGGLTGDLFPRNIFQVMAVMSGSEQVAGAAIWI